MLKICSWTESEASPPSARHNHCRKPLTPTGPRAPKIASKFWHVFEPHSDRSRTSFWLHFGPQNAPKIDVKTWLLKDMLQKSGFYVSPIKTNGFGSLLLNTRSKNGSQNWFYLWSFFFTDFAPQYGRKNDPKTYPKSNPNTSSVWVVAKSLLHASLDRCLNHLDTISNIGETTNAL